MMKEIRVLGIHINDRVNNAAGIQQILTKYGCSIRTRLGLHDVVDDYCSQGGLILLELSGDRAEWLKLENELLAIDHLEVQKMEFST
ncbi:MAG TPA: hypothetical protein VF298_03885 [Bacteroidales bacterium]